MNQATESSPKRSATAAANIGRILWGLVFIASSIVNLTITLPNPEFYRTFADLTFFPFYRRLILNVAIPNAQLITVLVVVFEFAVGVLTLSKGQAVRWGLIGTGAWAVFICPAMGWYTIGSPLFLIILLLLLRYDYDRSLFGLVLRRPMWRNPMLKVLSGIFIALHGLVHMWYVALSQEWIEFEPDMGWTSESWLLSGLLEDAVTRSLAGVIFTLATIVFVVSGVGLFAQADWWRTALLGSAIFSSASVLLYWDGSLEMIVEKGLIALLINAGIIVALFLIAKK